MASNRHLGRIIALQTLYELDFRVEVQERNLDREEVLNRNIQRYSEILEDQEFVIGLVHGVLAAQSELDAAIQPVAPEWPLHQIARVDRTVLRMGVYELKFTSSTPSKVVINEAVELAKAFGSDSSSKFVNGVLGTIVKQLEPATEVPVKTVKAKTGKKK